MTCRNFLRVSQYLINKLTWSHKIGSKMIDLRGKRFSTNKKMKNAVCEWSRKLATETSDTGIQMLIPRLTKCLELNGDYLKK